MYLHWLVQLVLSGVVIAASALPAQGGGYYDDVWAHRMKITVHNPGSGSADYPVRIEVPAKTLIEAGKMRNDMADLRFSDSSGYPLPFWIANTDAMQRDFDHIPVYVRLRSLAPGDQTIYLYFDRTKDKGTLSPQADYTAGSTACGKEGDPPYSGAGCGENTFGTFAFDCSDTTAFIQDHACIGSAGARWVTKAPIGNSSSTLWLHVRTRFLTDSGPFSAYFLTQSPSGTALENACGYRLRYEPLSTSTAADTYQMNLNNLHLEYNVSNEQCSSAGWRSADGSPITAWRPYHDSIQELDVKVTETSITVLANGAVLKTLARTSADNGLTYGHTGFNRGGWTSGGSGGSSDGIGPMWFTPGYPGAEPVATITGNADLTVKRIFPVHDDSPLGEGQTEGVPVVQSVADQVAGNTMEWYIYNSYPLSLPSQRLQQEVTIRNRGEVRDTFALKIDTSGAAEKWSIGYDYGSGMATDLPAQVTLGPGEQMKITVMEIPSADALFEGGNGRLVLDFSATSTTDYRADRVRITATVAARSDCYWKWRLPITVNYPDTNITGTLVDHQVLVSLAGVDLSDARSDGADVIVTDATGAPLTFWLKSFDSAAGSASLWVKMPAVVPGAGNTILVWWGNRAYAASRSSRKETFDLWEDWESRYRTGAVVGCPDGSATCAGVPDDPGGWRTVTVPGFYDWWNIQEREYGKTAFVNKGAADASAGFGAILSRGDRRWKNYEVSYSFVGEASGSTVAVRGDAPFQDRGNALGVQFFDNRLIFRPFTHGTRWLSAAQVLASETLGVSAFPERGKRYWVKVRLFQKPADGSYHIKVLVSPGAPADSDADADFKELTPAGGIIPDPAVSIASGGIGFSGWGGGLSTDNIRVRKYTEPAPTATPGVSVPTYCSAIATLSSPVLTPPFMNGRQVLLGAVLTPFLWEGDLTALYADCLLAGDCRDGEDAARPGTVSLWGRKDDDTPLGFGSRLEVAVAGDENRSRISDGDWQENGRYIFTAYDSNGDGRISCTATPADCIAFAVSNAATLEEPLGYASDGADLTRSAGLIRYARGSYVPEMPRSGARNLCSRGYGDTCQWKLGDIIHSTPLVVGVPNMLYADPAYTAFMLGHNNRDLVAYFASNEGQLHAVRLAQFSVFSGKYQADAGATELWSFIPNAVLPALQRTTSFSHEYTADGLLRAIDIKTSSGEYRTVLVGGLRSGGQGLFALDVTDPRTANLMWEKNSRIDPSGFAAIGETSSAPALGRLCEYAPCEASSTTNRWVALLGSGFAGDDVANLSRPAYLTVIDLQTGQVIKQVQVSGKRANVTTNIAQLRDKNGYLQKIVFGDHYGAVWRVNLATPADVATLLNPDKKSLDAGDLLFKPSDYVTSDAGANPPARPVSTQPSLGYAKNGSGGDVWWVYFGTGDLGPWDANHPYQRIYGVKDDIRTPYVDTDLVDMTATTAVNTARSSWFVGLGTIDDRDYSYDGTSDDTCASECTSLGNAADYCASTCRNVVVGNKDRNERVVTAPVLYGGYLFVSTYTPSSSFCTGGVSRFYGLAFDTGSYEGGLLNTANATNARSLGLYSRSGIQSAPLIFTGKRGGRAVASAVLNDSAGGLLKIPLTPEKFSMRINVLLWRRIR